MIIAVTAQLFLPLFAKVGDPCKLAAHGFFFLPPWWEYLPTKINDLNTCAPAFDFSHLNNIWLIGLAIIDMLMRLVGFLALISIFIGSIEYIISIGNPEKISNARKRIINSLVGIAIAFVAVALVTFAGKTLGG